MSKNTHGVLGAILYQIMTLITNILSLSGFILLIVFSIILIKRNLLKDK